MSELDELQQALGVVFCDPELLELALAHRSWAFEAGGRPNNERLEFLGDAVLGLAVTERIYRDHPEEQEGRLAKLRAASVNTRSLASVARSLGVGDAVRLGRGEEQSGGRDKDSILADTTEALIGALYLDQGFGAAVALVHRLLGPRLLEVAGRRASLDYKTSLQELCAERLQTLPVYQVADEGPDHAKRFTALVLIEDEILGTGEGRSKKRAEQDAAAEAHEVLTRRFALGCAVDGAAGP